MGLADRSILESRKSRRVRTRRTRRRRTPRRGLVRVGARTSSVRGPKSGASAAEAAAKRRQHEAYQRAVAEKIRRQKQAEAKRLQGQKNRARLRSKAMRAPMLEEPYSAPSADPYAEVPYAEAPPPPPPPTPDLSLPPPPASEGTDDGTGEDGTAPGAAEPITLSALDVEAIEAALAALEAQYGLTRSELLGSQTEVGDVYRLLMSSLADALEAGTEGVTGEALGRGILRSGIHARNQAKLQQRFAEQKAAAEREQALQLAQINQALEALDAQYAAEQTQTAIGMADEMVGTEEARADALELVD